MNRTSVSIWRERLNSPLTWHYVGLAILIAVVAIMGTRLGMDWAVTGSGSTSALASKQLELRALKMQTSPLRGLDKRVDATRKELKDFYDKRVPANYSSIAMRIGELGVKSGVHVSRVQYAQGAAGTDLTEITMDAGISGEYPQIMHFVNGLERDQTFFVIRRMALTGQQGGMVNLRLQVATWLRPADAAASGLPKTGSDQDSAPANAATKEGE